MISFAQETICTPNLQCLYARCGKRKNQPPLPPPLYFLMITFWGLSVWRLLARPCNSGRAWRRLSTMAAYQPSYLPSVISLSSLRGCGRRLSLFARRRRRRRGNHAHETQIARSLTRSFNLLRSAQRSSQLRPHTAAAAAASTFSSFLHFSSLLCRGEEKPCRTHRTR